MAIEGFRHHREGIVDEIGQMELLSQDFAATMRELLQGSCRLLGSITSRPHPVADELKRLPRVRLIEVTRADRDALVEQILRMLAMT